MGAITDQPAQPFVPPAPKPGVPPSGIANDRSIRGLANRAKASVADRQRQFINMMNNTAQSDEQKYANAAAALEVSHDVVDKFVDWVLFG